jgi:hypothetical protein
MVKIIVLATNCKTHFKYLQKNRLLPCLVTNFLCTADDLLFTVLSGIADDFQL